MARKKSYRNSSRNSNFKAVRFNGQLAAGALATLDLVSGNFITASDSAYRLKSIDFNAAWVDITDVIDGGMLFGIAHGDYTAAEIEEAIEASNSIDRGNKIANEQANRLVRVLGNFGSQGTVLGDINFNDGVVKRVKLNWPIEIGQVVSMWIYNSTADAWTTGSLLSLIGQAFIQYT